jgi:beta-carotene hydroxylase
MRREARLPVLAELGFDLVHTSRAQALVAFARPIACVAGYVAAVHLGWWWCVPIVVFLLFIAVVTVAHDVVHGALHLSARQTEWALFAVGAIVLESGHAYRASHFRHHRVFPGPDDPEGDPARMTFVGAMLHGPIFLARLWLWAWKRSARDSRERRWLALELAWPLAVLAVAFVASRSAPALLVYALLVIVGGWVYPLLTVHLPHKGYGDTPLTQTHTLRGRIVPHLFLELTYHLEHHLYPEVPSHNLAELSRRLDPILRRAGVRPRRVP